MVQKTSPLYSEYVIDGLRQEMTVAQMLSLPDDMQEWGSIVDETVDVSPGLTLPEDVRIDEYLDAVLREGEKRFPVLYAGQYSAIAVASALTDALWRGGHFRIGDLAVELRWQWNEDVIGNMAAFYSSAHEAASYLDSLGLTLSLARYKSSEECSLDVQVGLLRREEDDEDLLSGLPDHSRHPVMKGSRLVGPTLVDDPQSWIIFIPFDTCDFRLSGSLLSQAVGFTGAAAPQLQDADYFIDCFEVIREMAEDGVILAGESISDGGLLTALRHMCQDCGASINIADIMKSYSEVRQERVLFAEVPGVLLQIRDVDYDYFDAEMLLQDVQYFPLGHPVRGGSLTVENAGRTDIQSILDALIRTQGSEGED